jgi:hypothetical protein
MVLIIETRMPLSLNYGAFDVQKLIRMVVGYGRVYISCSIDFIWCLLSRYMNTRALHLSTGGGYDIT